MDELLQQALDYLHVADLTRAEWIAVGMALKEEGLDVGVWDAWSRNDTRYHPGECQKQWNSFNGSSTPVTGGTIVQMAKERGFVPRSGHPLEWDDEITVDDTREPEPWDPVAELSTYLSTLFLPGDHVGYVTNDVWQDKDGRIAPSKGVYDRTAGELLESLRKHPDDIGATVGDWHENVGAWIRFNPLDGNGVKNDNVTAYRYALVESDNMPMQQQEELYRRLRLPIAALVSSGGKSVHAIVKINAPNYEEYRRRVDFLYKFMESNGVDIDTQNRNPSRLSRMPGITRNGRRQKLLDTNIGCSSWAEWVDVAEGILDPLPEIEPLDTRLDNLPDLPPELIEGVLRCGHKMLVSGPSKAGKSFFLMTLCVCVSEGLPFLGHFRTRQGRVLYVNLEIDGRSAVQRFAQIREALGLPAALCPNLDVLNLRGRAKPLDKLVPQLVERMRGVEYAAVVIDPIYKVITGDENNASEMGYFCNQFDRICAETGAAAIYCHHHSKGAQGAKKAMDRASGSGVFARDPDAQLDLTPLELTNHVKNEVREHSDDTAFRLEFSLREFRNPQPLDLWFQFPLHVIDRTGELAKLGEQGSPKGNLDKSSKRTTEDERRDLLDSAYDALNMDSSFVSVKDLVDYTGKAKRTIWNYLQEFSDDYTVDRGIVTRVQ